MTVPADSTIAQLMARQVVKPLLQLGPRVPVPECVERRRQPGAFRPGLRVVVLETRNERSAVRRMDRDCPAGVTIDA